MVPFGDILKNHALLDSSQAELVSEVLHGYLEKHASELYESVDCLIFKPSPKWKGGRVRLDARRLCVAFPNLRTVMHGEAFELTEAYGELSVRCFSNVEELEL